MSEDNSSKEKALSAESLAFYQTEVENSLLKKQEIESSEKLSFEEFLNHYYE